MGKVFPSGVPYAQIPHDLIRDPAVDAFAVRVYAELMARANSESRSWPSQRTIARSLGMSRSKVQSSIDMLVSEQWLTVKVEPSETGHKQRHSYTVFGTRPDRLFNIEPDRETNRPATQTGLPGDTTGLPQGPEPDRETGHNKNQELEQELEPSLAKRNRQLLDAIYDTLVDIFGKPSPRRTSLYGQVRTWLYDEGATPAEIHHRSGLLAAEWGRKAVTITSLQDNWSRFDAQVARIPQDASPDELQRRRAFAQLEAAEQHALEEGTT